MYLFIFIYFLFVGDKIEYAIQNISVNNQERESGLLRDIKSIVGITPIWTVA